MDTYSYALPPQSRLQNGRYIIESTLSISRSGIIYLCSDHALEGQAKVIIKECFSSSKMRRDPQTYDIIGLDPDPAIKEIFHSEVNILRSLPNLTHIQQVYDCFHEHNTEYYVMPHIDGKSLSDVIESDDDEYGIEWLTNNRIHIIKCFIALAKDIAVIHEHNISQLRISPDNIIAVLDNNGQIYDLKLIDFITDSTKIATVIGFEDKTNRQSNDTYSLCITLHDFLCRRSTSRQDMAENESSSHLSPEMFEVNPVYQVADGLSEVIMQGTDSRIENRFSSMDELAARLDNVVGQNRLNIHRRISSQKSLKLILLTAFLAALAVILTIIIHAQTSQKFAGIDTVKFCFRPSEVLTVGEFKEGYNDLICNLDQLAGKGNYLAKTSPDSRDINIEVPLAAFNDQYVDDVAYNQLWPESLPQLGAARGYQVKGIWESLADVSSYGQNQVALTQMGPDYVVLSYKPQDNTYTFGKKNYLLDMAKLKKRLDTLGCPYAFGQIYGPEMGGFVVALSEAYCNQLVINSLGCSSFTVFCEETDSNSNANFCTITNPSYEGTGEMAEVYEKEDGSYGLRINAAAGLTELRHYMEKSELHTIVLRTGTAYSMIPTFQENIIGVKTIESFSEDSSILEFDSFCFTGGNRISSDNKYILEFASSIVNEKLSTVYVWSYGNHYKRGEMNFGIRGLEPDIDFMDTGMLRIDKKLWVASALNNELKSECTDCTTITECSPEEYITLAFDVINTGKNAVEIWFPYFVIDWNETMMLRAAVIMPGDSRTFSIDSLHMEQLVPGTHHFRFICNESSFSEDAYLVIGEDGSYTILDHTN